ncbi:hypothetical protein MML48_2g00001551 [Holotrichia oblita]|uniref:Uncharacterized protein n=1 Tax=Holotrichia oblita TaxID=644536 RepID=A0ACB9TML3_HOLOL|nr:hypothetical protein MML48_2g00001551 [Holotrichia oblita]
MRILLILLITLIVKEGQKLYEIGPIILIFGMITIFLYGFVKKSTMRRVLAKIREMIENPTDWNFSLTPEQMLLLTLRFYATGAFLNTVGDIAGVHKSTASKVIRKVYHAIAALRPQYINLSEGDEIREVNQGFYEIA